MATFVPPSTDEISIAALERADTAIAELRALRTNAAYPYRRDLDRAISDYSRVANIIRTRLRERGLLP